MAHQLGRVNGFQLLKFLGKGTFGAAYQARREADGKIYAIKKVDTRKMSTKERAEAVNEIRVLASVAGEHVITFYEAFVEQDMLYIVTEFAAHGDLLQLLKNKRRAGHLPEATVWSYFVQMCLGIKTMHDQNILHRDLKAANVFMCSPSYLKLGDLGVAKVLKHDQALASTQVGTPYYVAPEVWRNKPYNAKCDMWSVGCLLYELCTFRPPFEAESMEGLARKVMKGRYEQIPSFYSQALRTTLSKLLVVEPNFRASVNDILSSEIVLGKMAEISKSIAAHPNDHMPPEGGVDIVKTIPVPRRFNDLTKNLPPSRYDTPMIGGGSPPLPGPPPGGGPSPPLAANGGGAPPAAVKARNGAEGNHADVANDVTGDVTRLQRHAGDGNTVANAVASAQQGGVGYNKQGQRLPLVPGAQGGGGMPRRPQPPGGPPGHPAYQRQQQQNQFGQQQQQQQQNQFGAHPGVHPYGQPMHPHHKQAPPGMQPPGVHLPAVPGAKPPPTPASVYSQQQGAGGPARAAVPRYGEPPPSREIRMVYHRPNGESRISIYQRGQTRGHAYYNPITHQGMDSAAGSRYHTRNQPTNGGNGYPAPRSLAQQYSAQRQRVTPGHWY